MPRGGFSDFIHAFNQGFDAANKVGKDFAIAKLSNEKETPVYTEGQGQELEAIANAKDENGQPYYALDATPDGKYTVTPNFKGVDGASATPATIAASGVSYLGKTYDKPLTDSGRSAAKQLAMAGIMDQFGDAEGGMRFRDSANRMQREEKADAQNDQRFAWDKARNERDIRQGDQAEKDQGILRDVDQQTADWFKGRLKNADGTDRAATVDDHLAASQFRAAKLTEAGKVSEAGKVIADHNAQALVKIQLDSAQRDQDLAKTAAALNAGDLGAVKDFYNKYVPDGARVTNVTRDATGHINIERETMDGRKMPPTVMKDTGQMVSALASFKDPMSLYNWSQNEFRNNLALRADARAGAAEGRAQAEFDSKGSMRDAAEAEADLRLKIANADDSTPEGRAEIQRTQSKLLALKTGTRGALAGHDPADIVKARTLVAQGVYPSEGEALDALVSKPDKLYQTYKDAAMKTTRNADKSIESAKKMMADDGWVRSSSGTWKRSGGVAGAKPATQADAETQAKAAIANGADKDKVNERLKSMGFKPID